MRFIKSKLIFGVEFNIPIVMKNTFTLFLSIIVFISSIAVAQENEPTTTSPETGQNTGETNTSTDTQAGQTTDYSPQEANQQRNQQSSRNNAGSFKDRLYFGGSLGLQFGNVTYIEVSPIVGYRVTEKLRTGVGLRYIYYKYDDDFLIRAYESSIYGGSIFGSYYILPNLFAHVEFEMLNLDVPNNVSNNGDYNLVREWIASTMVGGGYAQSLGGRSALTIMLLWNLTEEQYTPYSNPVIRVGINVGL